MASALQKFRGLVLEALVALSILTLLIVISEGLFRLFAPADVTSASSQATNPEPLPRLHRTEDLARPGVRGWNAGALYEANMDGFRGPERSREKPHGVSRVAVIGDSTAMGWGVEEADTYSARLDQSLNLDPNGKEFEVLNFGLAGLNIEEVVQRLENLGLDYDPNVVIYGFALNDIRGPHYRESLDPEYLRSLFQPEFRSRLWQQIHPTWQAFRERTITPRGTFAYELDDNYFRNPEAWSVVRQQIEKLGELGAQHDFCTIFLVQAQLQSLNFLHSYRRHYEAVSELANKNGLHTLASIERLSKEDAPELWVSELDHHANAKGHAIFAEILAEGLAQLPPDCWESKSETAALENGGPN